MRNNSYKLSQVLLGKSCNIQLPGSKKMGIVANWHEYCWLRQTRVAAWNVTELNLKQMYSHNSPIKRKVLGAARNDNPFKLFDGLVD